jgi:hypothetical protein
MRGVQISYLIDHPEYISQLAQRLFEQWDSILGEETPEARIKKLKTHMNRDKLPIAWVAHANGQVLGTAALRVHDLEGREDLTPWARRSICGLTFSSSGYWCRTMCHRRGGGSVARDTDSLFVHARQAGVVFAPRLDNTRPVCLAAAAG